MSTPAVTVAPTDYRAAASVLAGRATAAEMLAIREPMIDEKGEALPMGEIAEPMMGEDTPAEQPAPTIPVTLTLTVAHESGVSASESVTADQCWQLTGVYGDTRRLVDLDDTALAEVLSVWTANVRTSLNETLADPGVAAEIAKIEALRERIARIEVL
jgi:hypothetical protein